MQSLPSKNRGIKVSSCFANPLRCNRYRPVRPDGCLKVTTILPTAASLSTPRFPPYRLLSTSYQFISPGFICNCIPPETSVPCICGGVFAEPSTFIMFMEHPTGRRLAHAPKPFARPCAQCLRFRRGNSFHFQDVILPTSIVRASAVPPPFHSAILIVRPEIPLSYGNFGRLL